MSTAPSGTPSAAHRREGVERHPPTVAPAHAAIDPGQERCELAVEADVALGASRGGPECGWDRRRASLMIKPPFDRSE